MAKYQTTFSVGIVTLSGKPTNCISLIVILAFMKNKTKQKPVVKLSGFCYTYFDKTSLIALTTFGELKNVFNFADTLSKSSWHFLQKCPLILGNLWCLHNSIFDFIYFNERFTRSESIIPSLTSEVKNVALKLRKISLGIKTFLARMSENLSKCLYSCVSTLTGCVVILGERLQNYTKLSLSTFNRVF